MSNIRVGSFNVENLFSRISVFDEDDARTGGELLRAAARLQELLEADHYDKAAIVRAYEEGGLSGYIDIRCDRVAREGAAPRFFRSQANGELEVSSVIDGRADWSGGIVFKRDELSQASHANIARVILDELRADVLCLCEVEDRATLRTFNSDLLRGHYDYELLIEGNDRRGIDVALLSRYPIEAVRTHTFLRDPADGQEVFSRDCLEVDLDVAGTPLSILCNHFKSKSGGSAAVSDAKRIRQSQAVAKMLVDRYRVGSPDARAVVVAGDLNEAADRNGADGQNLGGRRSSIDDLRLLPGLHDVLFERLPIEQRWTYIFRNQPDQIDYLLLSEPLNARVRGCGHVTSGRYTDGSNGIANAKDAASDHAAVWVDLELP